MYQTRKSADQFCILRERCILSIQSHVMSEYSNCNAMNCENHIILHIDYELYTIISYNLLILRPSCTMHRKRFKVNIRQVRIRSSCHEWFQRFKNGDFDVEDRHSGGKEKMQNWRHYLSKTRIKIKKNWPDHWE